MNLFRFIAEDRQFLPLQRISENSLEQSAADCHHKGLVGKSRVNIIAIYFPKGDRGKRLLASFSLAVFSEANELNVNCSCGLSRPYFGKLEATSSTNLVTRSFCSVSTKRRTSPEFAGVFLRLAIVQSSPLRARTVFPLPGASIAIRSR